ncbi:MAG: aminodeoxychorismate/anthranilate synthase component II [Clostridiales bacterium]|nr:aminodeoxychorismate/anthranilate synthase component II [Clostridiales bacterium]
MILLIDNYDSFSYNLYQFFGMNEPDIRVIRNDAMTVEQIEALDPAGIVISPGPGRPAVAGVCEEVVRKLAGRFPILGVCLGHQAICEALGGEITYAKELMHGKQSKVKVEGECRIFEGLPEEFKVARYHSLACDGNTLPECLEVCARTEDGEVMAVKHKDFDVYGLQFHPESIMTPDGMQMIKNFISLTRRTNK